MVLLLGRLAESLPDPQDYGQWERFGLLTPHVLAAAGWAGTYGTDTDTVAGLWNQCGINLFLRADYEAARDAHTE
ncbi:MAG: hypothetical protein OEW29_18660, partial [Acidimicrobiia bacterium]|nr:hypothetical protein [Acidimicrobiia bacterium]